MLAEVVGAMRMTQIHAPFTPEQVTALNDYQQAGWMHPFTCPREHNMARPLLLATEEGWRCPVESCDYTQGWAHDFMAGPNPLTTGVWP